MKWGLLTIFLLLPGLTIGGDAVNLRLDDALLVPDLWSLSQDDFRQHTAHYGFRWESKAHDTARSVLKGLTFMDEPVIETLVRFESNTISEVTLSLYNRGDAGDIDESAFEQRMETMDSKFKTFTGADGKDVSPRGASSPARKDRTLLWFKDQQVFLLEYAFTRTHGKPGKGSVQPEFISVTIKKREKSSMSDVASDVKADVTSTTLQKRVKKNENGDVLLDSVPMVDQGQKGYCAVASVERVMRYYGSDVNQHELAQRADTASKGGTDSVSLTKALKAMGVFLGVKIKVQEDLNDFMKIVADYNRQAKKEKTSEIVLPKSGTIYVSDVYASMAKAVFLASREKNTAAVARFAELVKEKIDAGYPVLHGVILGFVDEKPPLRQQRCSGHMRLIIGYNTGTSEILYSDSWGAGHELKRMSAKDAYAITTCMIEIEPR